MRLKKKEADNRSNMLTRPTPPMVDKVVQMAMVGDYNKLMGQLQRVLDKEQKYFLTYQIGLKHYLGYISKYNDNIEKCFSVIMGQCSIVMEQSLDADEDL